MNSPRWSSRLGLLFGAVGAAVGLGSVWRFPYLAGANGGFVFIAVFVLAASHSARRYSLANRTGPLGEALAANRAGSIAASVGYSTRWNIVGWTGCIAGFLILTYYTMIAGWCSRTYGSSPPAIMRMVPPRSSHGFQAFVADSHAVSLVAARILRTRSRVSGASSIVGRVANRWRAPALLAISWCWPPTRSRPETWSVACASPLRQT